jgi:hypothetical protein
VNSLDGLRLSRVFKAGILRLLSRQEHLNKIKLNRDRALVPLPA